jgi:hypothetical protein
MHVGWSSATKQQLQRNNNNRTLVQPHSHAHTAVGGGRAPAAPPKLFEPAVFAHTARHTLVSASGKTAANVVDASWRRQPIEAREHSPSVLTGRHKAEGSKLRAPAQANGGDIPRQISFSFDASYTLPQPHGPPQGQSLSGEKKKEVKHTLGHSGTLSRSPPLDKPGAGCRSRTRVAVRQCPIELARTRQDNAASYAGHSLTHMPTRTRKLERGPGCGAWSPTTAGCSHGQVRGLTESQSRAGGTITAAPHLPEFDTRPFADAQYLHPQSDRAHQVTQLQLQ